jgi:hypothetical protein
MIITSGQQSSVRAKDPDMPAKKAAKSADVQGEGDYRSARRYNERSREFVASHDVKKLGRAAAPKSKQEARAMHDAEDKARARAKTRRSARAK